MTSKKQTGLWIPNNILYSNLTVIEKIVLSDIICLSEGGTFLKTNQSIADCFNISLRTVNTVIKNLSDKELIKSVVSFPYGNVKKRRVIIPLRSNISNLKGKP